MSHPIDTLPLIQRFTSQEIALLRGLFHPCSVAGGEMLFQQGDPATHFYLVVEGEVIIRYKPHDGPALILTRVRREGVVGWSAAIGSPAYTSSAVCAEESLLLRVYNDDLRRFHEEHPETAKKLLEVLAGLIAERLRHTHPQIMALLEQGMRITMPQTLAFD